MKYNSNVLITLGFSTIFAPGFVLAAGPLAFDGWTTNAAGTIDTSVSCASKPGVTCKTLSSDKGFLQQEVKTPDYTYVRMIVTDPDGAGGPAGKAFAAETFIPFMTASSNGSTQGIASKQVVRDAVDGFTDQAEIQTGMMRFNNPAMFGFTPPASPTPATDMFKVRLSQTFDKPEYQSTFNYTDYTAFASVPSTTPDTDIVIGHTLEMSQTIPIPSAPNATAKQLFVHKQAGGYAGNSLPPPFPFGGTYFASEKITSAGSATLNGKTISWADADTISTSFVAENTSSLATTAQALTNVTTSTSASQTLTNVATPTSPAVWPAIFGTAPSFP
jgi:hypothetical protein